MFSSVDGKFDLIIFDPPFRWVAPRDLLEAALALDRVPPEQGDEDRRRLLVEGALPLLPMPAATMAEAEL